ncbi:helicase HerA domain-containing protein [Candidatus Poriferisodalis sp.]|uniref:helicase HerA domain-containing protein n=1 Tax=Candidatus Poriferisodalis sp. TaxID=3101277 RepID=UPI003B019939
MVGPGGSVGLGDALSGIVADHDQERQTFVDPGRLIGDVIQIDYVTADFLLHDSAKQAVGGVQQGSLLVAVRLGEGDQPDPGAARLLLRVVSSTPLPNDMAMRQARFDAAQRVADSPGNWDDSEVTDLFTVNLMRYSGVRCRILGSYQPPQDSDVAWSFSSDVDNFYSGRGLKVYKPTGEDLEQIVNSASRAADGGAVTKIGNVRYATSTPADSAAVLIAAEDFVAQRTALFGMTRTGKSNTVKIIARAVFELRKPEGGARVGQIIFDPDGEYANANPQDQGCLRNLGNHEWADPGDVVTYGLHPHPNDEQRNITKFNFFGNREPDQPPGVDGAGEALGSLFQGKRILDGFLADEAAGYIKPFVSQDMVPPAGHVEVGDWKRYRRALLFYRAILAAAGYGSPGYRPDVSGLFNAKVRAAMGQFGATASFVTSSGLAVSSWSQAADFARAFSEFVGSQAFRDFDSDYERRRGKKWSDSRLLELLQIFNNTRGLNVLRSAREWHDQKAGSNFTEAIVKHLQAGRLVIVDQSTGEPQMNETAARDVMKAVFGAQQHAFVHPEPIGDSGELSKPPAVLVYVEEAHTLLPHDSNDMKDVWVRSAKEGAKFNIGIVYSTQEPSSVHSNILKNTENWFITHLNNTDETRQLAKFNDFSDFTDGIINVNEPGYVKMRTLSSRFTVPVQIDVFDAPPGGDVS